jgi:hypothetical protein
MMKTRKGSWMVDSRWWMDFMWEIVLTSPSCTIHHLLSTIHDSFPAPTQSTKI